MFLRWINSYGMRKGDSPETDDYQAFKTIQLTRYLSMREINCFSSAAEKDMVMSLINNAWQLLRNSNILKPMTPPEKIVIYKRAHIHFPYFTLTQMEKRETEPIFVNFRNGQVCNHAVKNTSMSMREPNPCLCGSGLSYHMCCGRIKFMREIP